MSKRSRRLRTPNLPPEAFVTPQAARTESAPTRAPEAAAGVTKPAPASTSNSHSYDAPVKADSVRAVNWQQEYGAVLGDLKRTGILAGILLAIMVVLSIVIR